MSTQTSDNVITLPAKVLGGGTAVDFAEQIRSLIGEGQRTVFVDLNAVEIMNSSGLGMLVAGHSTLKRAGGSLIFRNVPDTVSSLLRMTHLDSVFSIDNDHTSQQQS